MIPVIKATLGLGSAPLEVDSDLFSDAIVMADAAERETERRG